MTVLSRKRAIICFVTVLVCSSLLATQAFSLSVEEAASRRQSMRSYNSENVSRQVLLDVLWAAYGTVNEHRTTPMIGSDYSLILFTVNETGCYKYIPETNSLVVHDSTVNKETIRPYNTDWPSDAKEVLVIVWDETKMGNRYFAAAEAGCVAQNVHLAAASYGLGTCVVGSIEEELRNALKLSSTLTPMLVMPLSYPTSQYKEATPDYDKMTGNLPVVQFTEASVEAAIQNMVFAQEWSTASLTVQELSQLLWAAYGYTSTDHRTTPSAYGIYPLVVYAVNATGVYKYLPESHSVTQTLSGDKRFDVSNTFSGQTWAADAPTLFVIGYDTSHNDGNTGDGGGVFSHLFIEVNAGCVIQQLLLEASALNLQANMLSEGLEEWNGAGAQTLRSILGLSSSIIPLYALPVGAAEGGDRTAPEIGIVSQEPALDSVEPSQAVSVSVEVTDEGVGVKEVVLVYSTDGGQTWTDTEMASSSGDTFMGQIQGFEEGIQVHYKVVAYDNNNNVATEDNAGKYYIYTVIPEFQFIILAFFASTALAVLFSKKRNK